MFSLRGNTCIRGPIGTGSTPQNLFSTSGFVQPPTTQLSFEGFKRTNTNNNFFTQQPANTSIFGTTNNSVFSQASNSTGFQFGTPTCAFGQPPQTTPFGQPNSFTNFGLFGSTTGFASTNTAANITGTTVKFFPVKGTDVIMRHGITHTISTYNYCITFMKEYEGKSLEELRLEDYTVGQKGPRTQATGFFTPAQTSFIGPTSTSNVFSTNNQPDFFKKSITGFMPPTTTSAFTFNSPTSFNLFRINTPFTTSTNTTTPTASTGLFNQNRSIFTVPTPLFPTSNTTPTTGLFNQNRSIFTVTNPLFPTSNTTPTTGLFNQNKSTFVSTTPLVSTNNTTPVTSIGLLNQNKPSFLTSTPFNPFAQQSTRNTSFLNTSFNPSTQTTGFPLRSTNLERNTFLNSSTFSNFNATTNNLNCGMNQAQQNAGSVPVHQHILALVSTPFGNSPLLKNIVPTSGKTKELIKPINPLNRSINSLQYKVSTNNSRIKPRFVPPSAFSKKSLFEEFKEEDLFLIETFQPRPNFKRLVMRPKAVTNISQSVINVNSPTNEPLKTSTAESKSINRENQDILSNDNNSTSSTELLKSSVPQEKSQEKDFDSHQSSSLASDTLPEDLDSDVAELRFDFSLNETLNTSEGEDAEELNDTPPLPTQSEAKATKLN